MTEEMPNGLLVSVDWLSFTIITMQTANEVIEFMGMDIRMFQEMEKGASGYKRMKKCPEHNISVLYDGNENMGIHVTVSGRGIAFLLDSYKEKTSIDTVFGKAYDIPWEETVLMALFKDIATHGHLTRLDVAVDDIGCNYYSVDGLAYELYSRKVVSKFRTHKHVKEKTLSNESRGYSIYLGSRSSNIMLRVYDKKLEQNKNRLPDEDGYVDFEWVRWELELADERANDMARRITQGYPLGELVVGVLYNYVRIIQLTDSNRSRCPDEPKWSAFINGIDSCRLYVRHENRTIEDKLKWLEKQVAPTMATVLYACGGDKDLFNDMAMRNEERISQSDRDLLSEYQQAFVNGVYNPTHKEMIKDRQKNALKRFAEENGIRYVEKDDE